MFRSHFFIDVGFRQNIIHILFMTDSRSQTMRANDVAESTYALPERTKRGPPTNKNIPVRNMRAQIANMSLNENGGFKSEYHVRLFFLFDMFVFSLHVCKPFDKYNYSKVVKI